jgi:uncharacterized repeat protein (TIGR01451 family)
MKHIRLLSLLGAVVLSFGLVTLALAAANASAPVVLSAESNRSPISAGLMEISPQPRGVSQPAPTPDKLPPSTSAQMPGFDQPDRARIFRLPPRPADQVTYPLAGGDWDGIRINFPRVISDTGQYRLWYDGRGLGNPGYGWMVGLAESPDGFAWIKNAANPLFGPGDPGQWDEGYRGQAAFLKEGGLYKMWYAGGNDSAWQTGYATSTNSIDWSFYAGNPVLANGNPGDWDEAEADSPSVINDGGTYKMWFHGCVADYSNCSIGYATSPDGVTWTKYGSNPVLTPGGPGEWDESWVVWPTVIKNGSTYEMWYLSNGMAGLATSPDGITWTKYAGNPVLSDGWDGGGVGGLSVLLEGATYKMWLRSGVGASMGIGYAESVDGINWIWPVSNPVLFPGNPGVVAHANYAHDWVGANTGPGETVTVTASSSGEIFTVIGQANWGGWFGSWEWPWNPYQPNLQPGDAITVEISAATTVINPVGQIDAIVDGDSDTVSGTIQAPWFDPLTLTVRCDIWVENGTPGIEVAGVPADGGSFFCDFASLGWDILPGQDIAVTYYEPDGDQVINVVGLPWMRVNMGDDWVGGNYPEGHTVWITVTDSLGGFKASAELQTTGWNGWGGAGFETTWENWTPEQPDIQAGDWTYIVIDDSYTNTLQAGEITGQVDIDENTVSGVINAPWFTPTLAVHCGVWYVPGGPPDIATSADPNGGSYFCDYDDVGWDLDYGQGAMVRYVEPDGDSIINVFVEPDPQLYLRVNYGHDWAEGNYESGHTLWITVTNSLGDIKATASGETGPIPWWGGQTGFSTNYNVLWHGSQPDLQAGDWVYGQVDNGYSAAVQLGVIDSVADVDMDSVNGTISAPWFTDTLHGDCGIWEDGGPGTGFDFDPNGGAFTCDFAGQWDIIPGNMIGVSYNEPDGDQVINMASNPAPYLRIWTWADGQPATGSNFVLNVQYHNQGDAPTENAIISATLEGGLTYLGDTSGLPVSGSGAPGNPLIWQLGALPPTPYGDIRFYLFVHVTAAAGDWITNTVHIDNGTPYSQNNPGEKTGQWSGQVIDNDTYINIGKGAWTWDPTPGSQFVYNVNVCNNGSTASSEVIMTDTLPLSTTLVSWWGQHPGWEEVSSSAHELVVSRPSLPGYWCSEVYLRVELDTNAWIGMLLHNAAYVYASNDLSPDDNETHIWHNVGIPHANLSIYKEWNWGELVPGGEIRYNVNYRNDGNLPADNVSITETLPASTTFTAAFWYDDTGGHPFTPTLVTDEIVVWEIGALDNGYGLNFEVILRIDAQAQPGMELVNTADITRLPNEDRYSDNTSTWVETLYDHGPNLRVRKTGDWHGHGEGHNAWYRVTVENVGDVPAEHVTVTDTLPISMDLDGDPDTDWSQVENYVRNDAEGWFSFTFNYLHPNWRRDIHINLVNPDPNPVPGGQFFTNQAEIMQIGGEPTYADNTTEYTLASGPDLYVEKSLIAGDILPGEIVTFSLLFGNDQPGHAWWWNLQGTAWLTDVLPAGAEFITATQRWCGNQLWCSTMPGIQGDNLIWQLWSMGTGEWNEFYVTVRLPDTLTGLDTVINLAEIASDQPGLDIEPDYANNADAFVALVELPYFEVGKVYESNRVAGMPITYTLTVTNNGYAEGTNVELIDWTPDGFTYLGGGSYNAGLVTWMLPAIDPEGGAATAQFWGALQCEAGGIVNNQYYRVESSDQGVTSTYGAPVSLVILTPTIEVSAEASALAVQPGETIFFTGTATTNGTPLSFEWDFDDGITATGATASHAFLEPGSYEILLTATDDCGFSSVATGILITVEPVSTTADLQVVKLAPESVIVSGDLTYTIIVTNLGSLDASNVLLTDTLPVSATFVSASAGCTQAAGVVTCDLGDLANGESATVVIVVTAPGVKTTLTNTVEVMADEADPDLDNNTATAETLVVMYDVYLPVITKGLQH